MCVLKSGYVVRGEVCVEERCVCMCVLMCMYAHTCTCPAPSQYNFGFTSGSLAISDQSPIAEPYPPKGEGEGVRRIGVGAAESKEGQRSYPRYGQHCVRAGSSCSAAHIYPWKDQGHKLSSLPPPLICPTRKSACSCRPVVSSSHMTGLG